MGQRFILARMAIIAILAIGGSAVQAQTAPPCPLCMASGYSVQRENPSRATGVSGATLNKGYLLLTNVFVGGQADQAETFVRIGVTERLELGFGYLWKSDTLRPMASYTLSPATRTRPAWAMGVLTDTLAEGRNGIFTSLSQDLERTTRIPASGYIGIAQISNENNARLLVGGNIRLGRGFRLATQFDGRYLNFGLTSKVSMVGGLPVYIGFVTIKGDRVSPLTATLIPFGR